MTSELDLIARLKERIGPTTGGRVTAGTGDDAAVTVPGGATATSVDAVVDGVHFDRSWAPLRAVGRKALAAALSDLAAMGAAPGEAYTVLGVPTDMDEDACLEVFAGIEALAAETTTTLAGGDVTRSPVLMLAMTVVGHATTDDELIRRAGASPGDAVVITGELGGAAAGLRLLQRPELGKGLDEATTGALIARQLEPTPRLAAGQALAFAGATAMIDVSDGLHTDATHVAEAGSVALEIDVDLLPVQGGVDEVATLAGVELTDLTAGGGEDYELLATLPQDKLAGATAATERTGTGLTRIGSVTRGSGVRLSGAGGEQAPPAGFDHLR